MRIVASLPDTKFQPAGHEQIAALMRIIFGSFPGIETAAAAVPDFRRQFQLAFIAVGFQFRLSTPDAARYIYAHVSTVNEFAAENYRDQPPVGALAVWVAALADGDIPWRAADPSVGQVLELGINPTTGKACRTPNQWKLLLSGEANLVRPTAPATQSTSPYPHPVPRFYRNGVEIDPMTEELWWPRR
jgi:hypothetical protein